MAKQPGDRRVEAESAYGLALAQRDAGDLSKAIVIRVAGDKVFVKGFAGSIEVVDKSRCTPVPIVSNAKVGEKVKAVWVGSFREGTVTKVDPQIGRVFIKFDNDEKVVPFGNVMK